ncbi:hypothetical protein BLOT_011277 [Blomia tropicalis]|nr:hypothetical protein BLOT_011277 [Blomia tropicalis]
MNERMSIMAPTQTIIEHQRHHELKNETTSKTTTTTSNTIIIPNLYIFPIQSQNRSPILINRRELVIQMN